MAIHKMIAVDGLPPNKWPVEHVADVDYDEPFVKDIMEISPVVDATSLSSEEREAVKHAIVSVVMDGLVPAFLDLRQIRMSVGKKIPIINREEPYGNMARKLWKAYKPLTEKAALAMGFKIGFLYSNDKSFNTGLEEFRKQNPELRGGFEKFLEHSRTSWQNDLADFRNKWLEHPVGNRKQFDRFYAAPYAESLFYAVWKTIADLLPALLELKLIHGSKLVEQHHDDPGPKWGQRFRYDHPLFRKSG